MGRPRNLVRGSLPAVRPSADSDFWTRVVEQLKQKATELGLGPTGVAAASSPESRVQAYERWLEAGFHGEMAYMDAEARRRRRTQLEVILPDVRAVVVSTLFYWPGRHALDERDRRCASGAAAEPRGEMSCYAWGRDYHRVMGDKLKRLAEWLHERAGGIGRWYVDTGALMERDLGARAGLGFVGKNTMLIHPTYGSGFFLGEILTTLPLPTAEATKPHEVGDAGAPRRRRRPAQPGCGACRRCQVACPTGAFASEYVLDARRCISYLTIELHGSVPEELRPKMGTRVYGCDVCQQVCPWNRFEWSGELVGVSPLFGAVGKDVSAPELLKLLCMDEAQFTSWFGGTAVERVGRERMRRNAAIALGNCGDSRAVDALKVAVNDASPLVAEHAQWALRHLLQSLVDANGGGTFDELRAAEKKSSTVRESTHPLASTPRTEPSTSSVT